MLTQLVGGDVVSACQSANLRKDIFAASMTEGSYKIPHLSEVPRRQDRDDSTQSDVRRKGGKGGNSNRSARGKNKGKKKEDSIEQFCNELNSSSGCITVQCNKRHNCSRRHRGGIFCNQKTHRRSTHDDQY